MQGMAVYHAKRDEAAERHLTTMVVLNAVSCIVMAAVAAVLLRGAGHAVDREELLAKVAAAAAAIGLALLNAGLAWGLRHHGRAARYLQIAAAVGVLPLFPLGSAWGAYALWALCNSGGQALFTPEAAQRRRQVDRRPAQPYYVAIMPAVAVGVGLVTFGVLKSDELWLARKVRWAAEHEASQRAAVGRSLQHLRDLSADDLADERLQAASRRTGAGSAETTARAAQE